MNEFKFISYEATPKDQYILGIATVLAYGKMVLRFKHSKTKDGTSDFFAPASYGITDETGQKRYIDSFTLDSAMEKETLMALVRRGALSIIKGQVPKQEMMQMPNGLPPQPSPNLTPDNQAQMNMFENTPF